MKSFSRILVATCVSLGISSGVYAAGIGSNPKGKPFVAINDQIVAVQGEVSDLQDQMDSIVAQVDTIEARIAANETAIADLEANNAYLLTLISANATSIDEINAEIATLQDEVAFLQTASGDNSAAIVANQALISDLQAALLAVENGLVSLEADLQGQIDANSLLIGALQQQIGSIQDLLAFKQNLAAGSCPDGSAVVDILADGTAVCGSVGGGAGGLSVQSVFNIFPVSPGQSIGAYASCPANTLPIGGGWYGPEIGAGGVIVRDEPTTNAYSVIFRNYANYSTYIRVQALCANLN